MSENERRYFTNFGSKNCLSKSLQLNIEENFLVQRAWHVGLCDPLTHEEGLAFLPRVPVSTRRSCVTYLTAPPRIGIDWI